MVDFVRGFMEQQLLTPHDGEDLEAFMRRAMRTRRMLIVDVVRVADSVWVTPLFVSLVARGYAPRTRRARADAWNDPRYALLERALGIEQDALAMLALPFQYRTSRRMPNGVLTSRARAKR